MKNIVLISLFVFINAQDSTQAKRVTASQILLDAGQKYDVNILFVAHEEFQKPVHLIDDSNIIDVLRHVDKFISISWKWTDQKTLTIKIDDKKTFQLVSKDDGNPIVYASITNEKDFKNISDKDGFFDIPLTMLGREYHVEHTNFIELQILLTNNTHLIELEERRYYSDPVQIVSNKQPVTLTTRSVFRTEIHKEAMESLNIEGDLNEKISFFSGVASMTQKEGGLSIQSSPNPQHHMYFDRMTIYQQNHLFGYISSINDDIIDKISLYKGSYPARYGGRLSGIIDIESKASDFDTKETSFSIDLLKTEFQTQFNLSSDLYMLLSFRRSLIDLYSTTFTNDILKFVQNQYFVPIDKKDEKFDSESTLPEALFFDLNMKLAYTPTSKDYVTMSVFRSIDENSSVHRTQIPRNNGSRLNKDGINMREWNNDGLSLMWMHDWTEKWSGNMTYAYSFYKNNIKTELNDVREATEDRLEKLEFSGNSMIENSVSLSLNHRMNEDINTEFGYQFLHHTNKVDNESKSTLESLRFINEQSASNHVVYVQQEFKYETLLVNAGLRMVGYSESDDLFIEPRFSISNNFQPLILTLNYSEQDQFLKYIYNHSPFSSRTNSYWILSVDDLPVEHAKNTSLTLSHTGEFHESEIEAFYNQVSGQTFSFTNFKNEDRVDRSNSKGRRIGMTFSHNQKFNPFLLSLRYQISESTYDLDVLEDRTFYMSNDHRHQVFVNVAYTYQNFDFQLSNIYKSGAPYTNLNLDEPNRDRDNIYVNNDRLPDYHSVNVSSRYTKHLPDMSYSFGLKIENLFNHTNIYDSYYENLIVEVAPDPRDNKFKIFRKEIEMIGFLPSVFFEIKF